MYSRFLSVVAVTGMLLAAGCGGGTGSAVSPSTGSTIGGGTGSGPTNQSVSFSFNVANPSGAGTASSSSSRNPQFVSGAAVEGVVLLCEFGPNLAPASNACAGPTGANPGNPTPTFALGTQAVPFNFTTAPAAGPINFNPCNLTGAAANPPTGNCAATYTIVQAGNYSTVTIKLAGLTVPAATTVQVGVVLMDKNGVVLSEGQKAIGILVAGPTLVPLTLNGVPATAYIMGGPNTGAPSYTGAISALLGNGAVPLPISLAQAVTDAQVGPGGTALCAPGVAAPGCGGSYEFSVFVADYDGSTITSQLFAGGASDAGVGVPAQQVFDGLGPAPVLPAVAATYLVSSTVAGIVNLSECTPSAPPFAYLTATDPLPTNAAPTCNLTAAPPLGGPPSAHNAPGWLVGNSTTPTVIPGTATTTAGAPIQGVFAGESVNVQCMLPGITQLYVQVALPSVANLNSTATAPVNGFTYSTSNYPQSIVLGQPTSPTTIQVVNLSCNPNLVLTIN